MPDADPKTPPGNSESGAAAAGSSAGSAKITDSGTMTAGPATLAVPSLPPSPPPYYPYGPHSAQPAIVVQLPQLQQQQLTQQIQSWQGPFPPPDAIKAYEEILPGTFERMLRMAEGAQHAEIETIQRAQEFTRRDIQRGHYLGILGMLAAMGGAIWCVKVGQPVVAGLFLSVPVMAVIKILVDSARAMRPSAASQTISESAEGAHEASEPKPSSGEKTGPF